MCICLYLVLSTVLYDSRSGNRCLSITRDFSWKSSLWNPPVIPFDLDPVFENFSFWNQTWWYTSLISTLRKPRQEGLCEFQDLPGLHRETLFQKNKTKTGLHWPGNQVFSTLPFNSSPLVLSTALWQTIYCGLPSSRPPYPADHAEILLQLSFTMPSLCPRRYSLGTSHPQGIREAFFTLPPLLQLRSPNHTPNFV